MKKMLVIIASALLASACSSDKAGQDLYATSEVGQAKRILPCTVISTRAVMIREEGAGNKGEAIGFIAGALATAENNDSALVRYIGGLVGGAAGRAASDNLSERAGVEYTVLLASGEERQLIQDIQDGEDLLDQGEACRLQVSGSLNRVLPAAHYPDAVSRPRKTGFND
jgi:outer membrane lipoprotein SlyB